MLREGLPRWGEARREPKPPAVRLWACRPPSLVLLLPLPRPWALPTPGAGHEAAQPCQGLGRDDP